MPVRKDLLQKLTSYCSLAASAIAAHSAGGQVVYTAVNPQTATPPNELGFGSFDADLNNDGIADVQIQKDGTYGDCYQLGSSLTYCFTFAHISIKGLDAEILPGDYCSFRLNQGDTIGPDEKWTYQEQLRPGVDQFIGVRLKKDNEYHYGWIRFSVQGYPVEYFVVKDFAYDSIPNQSILAGEGATCNHFNAVIFTPQSCVGNGATYAALNAHPAYESNYEWLLNGTSYSTTDDNSFTPSLPGKYQVIVRNLFGCADTSQSVYVSNHLTIFPPTISVEGSLLISSPAYSYQWFRGDNPIDGATNQNHSPPDYGNYSVQVTDKQGCTAFSSIDYTKCSDYHVQITALPVQTLCLGNPLALSSNTPAVKWQWQLNGITRYQTAYSIYANVTGTYRLIATSVEGCVDTSNSIYVLVGNPFVAPKVSIQGDTLISTKADHFQWYSFRPNFFRDAIPGATDSMYIPPENGDYLVQASDSDYCPKFSQVVHFQSCDKIHAQITSVYPSGDHCSGSYLRAQAENGYSYQWLIGDKKIPKANDYYYTPYDSGTYRVIIGLNHGCPDTSAPYSILPPVSVKIDHRHDTLFSNHVSGNVWELEGCSDTTVTGSFFVPPFNGEVILTYTDSNGCSGSAIESYFKCDLVSISSNEMKNCGSIQASALNASLCYFPNDVVLQWRKNGADIPGATNIYYFAQDTGRYDLQVTKTGSCNYITNSIHVRLYAEMFHPLISHSGNEINTSAFAAYSWQLNGSSIEGASNQSYVPIQNGSYTIEVTDSNGCQWTSDPYYYYSCSAENPVIQFDDTISCSGKPNNLYVWDCGAAIQWQMNGATIPGATNCNYQPETNGMYRAIITYTDCCVDTTPAVRITTYPETIQPIITQKEDTLVSNVSTGNYWFVQYGSEPLSNENKFIPPTSDATYYDEVLDSNGCVSRSAPFLYKYCNNVRFTLTTNSTRICSGAYSTLLVAPRFSASKYQWFKNGVEIPGATWNSYSYSSAGAYKVVVTYLSCVDTTNELDVTVLPDPPKPVILERNDTLIAPAGYSYIWETPTNSSPLSANQFFYPYFLGVYKLVITDSNQCSSASTYQYEPCDLNPVSLSPYPCVPYSRIFADLPYNGGVKFYWYQNGKLIDSISGGVLNTREKASYFVITKSASGCFDTSNTIQFETDSLPAPVITQSHDTLFTTATQNVEWWFNYSDAVDSNTNFHVPRTNGDYFVSTFDQAGCNAQTPIYSYWSWNLYNGSLIFNNKFVCRAFAFIETNPVESRFLPQWFRDKQIMNGENNNYLDAHSSGNYYCVFYENDSAVYQTKTAKVIVDTVSFTSKNISVKKDTLISDVKGQYQWYFNSGIILGARQSHYVAIADGDYTVSVIDSLGCFAWNNLYFQHCAEAKILNDCDGTSCAQNPVSLIAAQYYLPDRSFNYQWLQNNIPVDTTTGNTFEATKSAEYKLVLSDNFGCTDTSGPVHITIHDTITPAISQHQDTLFCSVSAGSYQWYRNNNLIPGATYQFYIPTSSASYSVVITDSFRCNGFSNPYSYLFTGLNTIPSSQKIVVSPNPSTGDFMITGSGIADGNWSVQIEDDLGNIVLTDQLVITHSRFSLPIHLSNVSPGIYLLRIFSKGTNYTGRIDLER